MELRFGFSSGSAYRWSAGSGSTQVRDLWCSGSAQVRRRFGQLRRATATDRAGAPKSAAGRSHPRSHPRSHRHASASAPRFERPACITRTGKRHCGTASGPGSATAPAWSTEGERGGAVADTRQMFTHASRRATNGMYIVFRVCNIFHHSTVIRYTLRRAEAESGVDTLHDYSKSLVRVYISRGTLRIN